MDRHKAHCWRFFLLGLIALLAAGPLWADDAITNPISYERLRQKTMLEVKQKLAPLLNQYCGEACQIIDVEVTINETIPEVSDLGFEGVVEGEGKTSFYAERVVASIQIDKRMTQANRERLLVILNNHLKHFGVATQINWVPVELPRVGHSLAAEQLLHDKIKRDIDNAVRKVIATYCPHTCILSEVYIQGALINPDAAKGVDPRELVHSDSEDMAYHLEKATINLAMDQKLSDNERQNILNVLKARTKFVRPLDFEVDVTPFPESYTAKAVRLEAESNDPYGLEKLRRMLTLFRELAGTKEIISTSSSALESKQASSSATANKELNSSESTSKGFLEQPTLTYGLIALGVLILFGFLMIRYAQASRDARMLMQAYELPHKKGGQGQHAGATNGLNATTSRNEEAAPATVNDFKSQLQHKALKEELVDIFVNAPKVAKETFTRFLQEEGVEETAKYVHIFGKMIIFELLSDTSLQRNLYELSEYYHKSNFSFTRDEEYKLLVTLKTKVTANEIRVLSSQTIDQFDFLLKLDTAQLFSLIGDENPQLQSIVLTQITPQRRRGVFDMFEGKAKVKLMNELCKADSIPKEFLYNVAMALSKKVLAKPEFDTQSLRSSDIMLELLEKSSIKEQKSLMHNLSRNNRDAARLIKLKLVTIHMLPFMKDGHLLELVLGLEREDLLLFLAGCPDHIQRLLISHAPRELAESWVEDLQNVGGVDEGRYRVVEMVILGKIRQLAAIGAINLLELNELIFADTKEEHSPNGSGGAILNHANLVA